MAGALALALLLVNLWWLHRFRAHAPLSVDENGYLSFAWSDAHALRQLGLSGLWEAYRTPRPFAPLLELLTSVPLALVGNHLIVGFSIGLFAYAGLIGATFGLARRLAGPWPALLATLLTATAPGVIDYSRIYEFAVLAAALFTAALWALLASEGLRRRGPALAFGALLGATLLARTMMIAFAPGLILAGVVAAVLVPAPGPRQRLVNLFGALVLAVAVAATWWQANVTAVLNYLTKYGYGRQSRAYGPAPGVLSLHHWTDKLSFLLGSEIYLPLAFVLGVGLGAWLLRSTAAARSEQREDRRRSADWRGWAPGPGTLVALVLAEGYLALCTTANLGSGFALPLIAPAAALSVLGLTTLARFRRPAIVVCVLVAAINVVSKADVIAPLSRPRGVDLPVLGHAQLLDGRGHLQRLISVGARLPAGRVTAPPGGEVSAYRPLALRIARFMFAYARARQRLPIVCSAVLDPLFNGNALVAAANYSLDRPLPQAALDPLADGGNTLAAYRQRLSDPRFGQPNFLITDQPSPGERALSADPAKAVTLVSQPVAEAAARSLGFRLVATMRTPAGNAIFIFWLERGPSSA